MIFVDTNVFVYAVGRPHPLREPAQAFFIEAADQRVGPLCTSSEVLQELLHIYLPVSRLETLEAAFTLATQCSAVIWSIDKEDVFLARQLAAEHPALSARDLLHLACCRRRSAQGIKTFDRGLASVTL